MKKSLIGKTVTVVEAKNISLKGVEGKVIDETKNAIRLVDKQNKEKMIIKNQVTLKIDNEIIEGKKLTKRIEERIKK